MHHDLSAVHPWVLGLRRGILAATNVADGPVPEDTRWKTDHATVYNLAFTEEEMLLGLK